MTDELRSLTWNELQVKGESVSSPVTGSNGVVDLLHLDTRYKTVVGFMPITALEIPLQLAGLVWSDGTHVERKTISLTDTTPFGTKTFKIPFNATGKKWIRFSVWDSAGDGAYVQPIALGSGHAMSAGQ